jgi:hypothetical protein
VAIAAVSSANPAGDGHCRGMSAGHLNDQCAFHFVPRLSAFDKTQGRVDRSFGDAAVRQSRGGLQLKASSALSRTICACAALSCLASSTLSRAICACAAYVPITQDGKVVDS